MGLAISMVVVYLIGLPLVIYGVCALHRYLFITRKKQRMKRGADMSKLPTPLWGRLRRYMAFGMFKDTRPVKWFKISHVKMFWLIYGVGLIMAGIGGIIPSWSLVFTGFLMFFVACVFSVHTGKIIIKERDKITARVLKTVSGRFIYDADEREMPNRVVIKEWADFIEPRKIEIVIPSSFSADMEPGFMKHFNQNLSKMTSEAEERTWVPLDDSEKGVNGWDYGGRKLTLRTVPPLPKFVKFHENYVLGDRIADSFFPLGIGVEDGVEMEDPFNPGSMVNVIGVDVNGGQSTLGKKNGFYVSPIITSSPHLLVAGSSGSGKSLDVETLIPVSR